MAEQNEHAMQAAAIVVGLGELLWDCFPDRRLPGGAPANVAFHAGQLGMQGVICSSVGTDELGDEMLRFIAENGLSTAFIQHDAKHGTGRVDITSDERGEPRYDFAYDVAWDHLLFDEQWRGLAQQAGAVCFGTLAQRSPGSRTAIHQFLAAAPPDAIKVYDVNLRQPWYQRQWIEPSLRIADIVKLNHEEVETLAAMLAVPSREPRNLAGVLQAEFGAGLVCVTRGKDGCLLVRGDEVAEQPGIAVREAFPVGAGDALTAALIFTQLNHWPLEASAQFANRVAALVAGKPGAMPPLRDDFEALIAASRSRLPGGA
jgi:fructokinase